MRWFGGFFFLWKVAIVPIVAAQTGSSEGSTPSAGSILGMLSDSWASYGLQLLVILSVLSLAPAIVMMVTSFTRFSVVFSLLRNSLGTQQAPPNMVLISLSLFLTSYVMAPTVEQAYREGLAPMMEKKISQDEAYPKIIKPFHQFMNRNVRQKDLKLFFDLTKEPVPKNLDDVGYKILIPAFMISELHKAFEIGFIIFIPFLIIDLVISSILMAMGMMMLPPVLVSLPFKIVFFILIDGWNLLCGGLVDGFN